MAEQVPKPALLIYLSASTKLLTARIRDRKRDFELRVDPAYYAKLNDAYEKFFDRYEGQKLKIPMDEWDFLRTPDLYRRLSLQIDEHLKSR
jgi:deoxyguanosine kinase